MTLFYHNYQKGIIVSEVTIRLPAELLLKLVVTLLVDTRFHSTVDIKQFVTVNVILVYSFPAARLCCLSMSSS